MQPQLATLVDEVPTGSGWLHEYKYDGYRLLIATGDGAATAWTRNGKDWSDKFRALVKAAEALPAGCLIDGEAVALGKNGKPDFQLLQSTLKDRKGANLAYYAFDLLVDRGKDIRKLPNIERKARLAALLDGVQRRRSSMAIMSSARARPCSTPSARRAARASSPRRPSAPIRASAARNWLKVKCIQRQEFVIVGWSESDKRRGFRSLLLATRDGKKLTYAGKVGTGFNAKPMDDLLERMAPLEVDERRVEVPRAERKGAHFIKPELVAEIAFTEFTRDGILRHPSFIGLREDKPAKDVMREVPQASVEGRRRRRRASRPRQAFGARITNPDRVDLPGGEADQGRPRRLLCGDRAA